MDNILRVGGRLKNANILYDEKHFILLPKNNHVTDLIIQQEHIRLYHAVIQATLYQVRMRYWPLNGKEITFRVIHACIKCFRFAKAKQNHIIRNCLQTELRSFTNTGINYCGCFYIKEKKRSLVI
jgi:hypothetical protein